MPLSEREQKILDEIEKNLADEDPRFAHERRPTVARGSISSRARLGLLVFAIGFVLLIVFFVSRALVAGLFAFVAMVAGIVLLASPVGALVNSAKENTVDKGAKVKRSIGDLDEDIRRRFRRR